MLMTAEIMREVKSSKLNPVGKCTYKPQQTTSLIFPCEFLVTEHALQIVLYWTEFNSPRVSNFSSSSY